MTENQNTKTASKTSIRTKLLLGIIGLIALVVIVVTFFILSWKSATYEEVQTMYPLKYSQNKEASAEFLKAMEYRIYINQLHPFFDYNSVVMAPLLQKIDYHFQKGKALLPEDSVEYIVWWTLFYKEIHGLLGNIKNDTSMSYAELPYKEFIKVHDKVYEMIMRYPEGKVYFNIDEINKFRFKTMAILVGFYYKQYSYRYSGKSDKERETKEDFDPKVTKLFDDIKKKYKIAYKKYIAESSKKKFMEREYFTDLIYISADIIAKYTFINNSQKLPASLLQFRRNTDYS